MLLYAAEITLKFNLRRSNSQNFPVASLQIPHNYQQNSQDKVCTLRLPKYVSYMQGPHINNLPWFPWILSVDLPIYSTIVLYIWGITKALGFWPKNLTYKPAKYFTLTTGQCWSGTTKPKNATLNLCTKLLWKFKIFLFNREFSTDWPN